MQKATKARKDGLLSLEADLGKMREGFFKNGIELAINERDAKRLRTFLNLEMNNIHSRHHAGQELFLYMASYAPAFGMLGTVLGLIIMMNNFSSGDDAVMNAFDICVPQAMYSLAPLGSVLGSSSFAANPKPLSTERGSPTLS